MAPAADSTRRAPPPRRVAGRSPQDLPGDLSCPRLCQRNLSGAILLYTIAVVSRAFFSESKTHGRSEEHTLNSSHSQISYAVFCLKKKKKNNVGEIIMVGGDVYRSR